MLPTSKPSVEPPASVDADPDLLAAALLNLLDNALRHGASRVVVSVPRPGVVRLHDDGPGRHVWAAWRRDLRRTLPGLMRALKRAGASGHASKEGSRRRVLPIQGAG